MKKQTTIMTFIILCFFILPSIIYAYEIDANVHDGLELQASVVGNGKYLPLEPIQIQYTFTNVSNNEIWLPYKWSAIIGEKSGPYFLFHVTSGPEDIVEQIPQYVSYYDVSPKVGDENRSFSMQPGEIKSGLLTEWYPCRFATPGIYKGFLRLALGPWDTRGWHGTLQVPLTFEIIKPSGIDKKALNVIKDCIESTEDEAIRCLQQFSFVFRDSKVLENYPNSTYSGWRLAQISPGATMDWGNGRDLIADMLKPVNERKRTGRLVENSEGNNYPKTKDGKYFIKSADKEAEEYIKYASIFLKSHPDHIMASKIYQSLSLAYMVLNRWQEAYEAGTESINRQLTNSEIQRGTRILRESLDELIRRGFARTNLQPSI